MEKSEHQPIPINDFDGALEEALRLIRREDFKGAVILASRAYGLAPNPSEKARASRDLSAAYRHQGNYDEAEKWATEAVDQHRSLAEEVIREIEKKTKAKKPDSDSAEDNEKRRKALREWGASVATLGTCQLSRITKDPDYDTKENRNQAAENMREGLEKIKESRKYAAGKNSRVDQYDINFTARSSYAEALDGNIKQSLALGAKALWLALWSESPKLNTTNLKLSAKERRGAKTRAFVRGLGAIAVAAVAPFSDGLARRIVGKLT